MGFSDCIEWLRELRRALHSGLVLCKGDETPKAKPERVAEQHPSPLHVESWYVTLQHVSMVTNGAGH